MTDLNSLVSAISAAAPDAPIRLRQGVITAVAADSTCTVTIGGGTTTVAGVKVASSCCPIPNSTCWIATDGRDMFVLDTLAPAGPAYGSMRQNAAQAIANNAFTEMNWTTRTDTNATGITITNSGFTCVVPGLYTVTASATFAANATGQRHMNLVHNGTTEIQGYSTDAPTGGDLCRMTTASTFKLAATDTVSVNIYQSSGANLNTNIGVGHNILRAVWVGPAA